MLQIGSFEDIERVFKVEHPPIIRAVLRLPRLLDFWDTPEGKRALAILRNRDDIPKELVARAGQINVFEVYRGSDSALTKKLFARLKPYGIDGQLAIALFRAQKASGRAKVYRGAVRGRGSFREMAYDRKQDALINFCDLLEPTAYIWGWSIDDKQQLHKHVLYVDLPTGQVSFHSSERGAGPDYSKPWDGKHGQCPRRVCEWIESILVTPVQIA
jgi:hypothetical protein